MENLLIFIQIFLIVPSCLSSFYGYSKREQHNWPREFKSCAGKMQSPIAISTSKSTIIPLPALEMNGFHDFLASPITLINNGHSVALNIQKEYMRHVPHVFGATLPENYQYELEGLHFHWGMKNNRGSEHILNGIRYPLEMHILHKNIIYPSLKHALEYQDGLTVLGVFFQLQDEDNEKLNPLLKNLPKLKWTNTEIKLNVSLTLNSLLPRNTDTFYSYKGSLTTPPCSETVTWIIFSTPVAISFRQMNKFRILSNGEDILADNFRRLQNIGKRKIYMRKLSNEINLNTYSSNFNISELDWFWQ